MDANEEASMETDLEAGMEGLENLIQSLDDPKVVEESNEAATEEEEGEILEESNEPPNVSENNDEVTENMDES